MVNENYYFYKGIKFILKNLNIFFHKCYFYHGIEFLRIFKLGNKHICVKNLKTKIQTEILYVFLIYEK